MHDKNDGSTHWACTLMAQQTVMIRILDLPQFNRLHHETILRRCRHWFTFEQLFKLSSHSSQLHAGFLTDTATGYRRVPAGYPVDTSSKFTNFTLELKCGIELSPGGEGESKFRPSRGERRACRNHS